MKKIELLKDEHNKSSLALINEDLGQVRRRLTKCIDLIDEIELENELNDFS
jgi:hypothetical protein